MTKQPEPTPRLEELSSRIQTALVFAARYTHDRSTGGTLMVTDALNQVWGQLSPDTRKQILRESSQATANTDEWAAFRQKWREDSEVEAWGVFDSKGKLTAAAPVNASDLPTEKPVIPTGSGWSLRKVRVIVEDDEL